MTLRRTITRKVLLLTAACLWVPTQPSAAVAGQTIAEPEIVRIAPGTHRHRVSGEFLQNGLPVDAPTQDISFDKPIHMMKYQVSRADYERCIAEKACELTFKQTEPNAKPDADMPVTGVSYIDARNYAAWLSAKTGTPWRLPTDAEWAYAAGSRFFDDASGIDTDPDDPSKRMLSKYRQAIELDRDADPTIRPSGSFGANENGLYDLSGNVWEWTDTCYTRSAINADGQVIPNKQGNCGVRVVEGRHRAYMTFFVQDAKSGGCAVGTPPDYLGFRLVKDTGGIRILGRFHRWLSNQF